MTPNPGADNTSIFTDPGPIANVDRPAKFHWLIYDRSFYIIEGMQIVRDVHTISDKNFSTNVYRFNCNNMRKMSNRSTVPNTEKRSI